MTKYNEKYSKEILESAVKDCYSVASLIRKLGIKQSGGIHSHINRKLIKFNIDTSHFKGQGHNKGKQNLILLSEDILVNNRLNGRREKTQLLKRAMLCVGFEERCSCGLGPSWNEKKLVLQIDHKDGNPLNNCKENLRFLCPNCHSQTDNFCSKNNATVA